MIYQRIRIPSIFTVVVIILSAIFLAACDEKPQNQSLTAEVRSTQILLLTQRAQLPTEIPLDPQQKEGTQAVMNTQQAEITRRTDVTHTAEAGLMAQQVQDTTATQSALELQATLTAQTEALRNSLLWKADFETGDISQVKARGDFLNQASGSYNLVTQGHSGNYSVGLTIDTSKPSESGSHASYLFVWDQTLLQGNNYYSAWYYIPTDITPLDWWNIWQWKTTSDGNSDHSIPMFDLDVVSGTGGLDIRLIYRPDLDFPTKKIFTQSIKKLPTGQWFHLEAYYQRGMNSDGQVIIWLDGIEIFNITGYPTVLGDNTIYWSVNNYTSAILPNPNTIYIDDMAISLSPIGNAPLP